MNYKTITKITVKIFEKNCVVQLSIPSFLFLRACCPYSLPLCTLWDKVFLFKLSLLIPFMVCYGKRVCDLL